MRAAAAALLVSSVIAVSATVSACSGSGSHHTDGKPPSGASTGAASGSGSASGAPTASAAWTANVTWARAGLVQTGVPATPAQGIQYQPPVGFSQVAVVGDTIVTADIAVQEDKDPEPVTLQFRNASTGGTLAEVKLATWNFGGIRTDVVNGKPAAEVRYIPYPDPSDSGVSDFDRTLSVVFDASGHQLWTSAGQQMTNMLKPGLLNLGGGLVSHGYVLRFNPGANSSHQGGSYDVVDLSGKVAMTVPYHSVYYPTAPMESPVNSVGLVGGYVVVTHGDKPSATPPPVRGDTPPGTPFRIHFTVYDPAQHGKQIADALEAFKSARNNVYTSAGVAAVCGSKLLLSWDTGSMLLPAAVQLSVLDVATGKATPPVSIPITSDMQNALLTTPLTDAACSTALVHGTAGRDQITFAVNLAQGTLLWQNADTDHDVSMRDGTISAIRSQSIPATQAGAWPTLLPGRPLAISAADGTARADSPAALPLAYTADGAPVFAAASDPGKCSPPPPAAQTAAPTTSPTPPLRPSAPNQGAYTQVKPLPALCAVTVWVGKT